MGAVLPPKVKDRRVSIFVIRVSRGLDERVDDENVDEMGTVYDSKSPP
jgi:hypothetical protein